MSCQETEARLTDLLDRRLAPSDEIRLHDHLESCAPCRERVAVWEAVTPAMRRLAPPPLPPLAIRRMEVEIERALVATAAEPSGRWPWRRGGRWRSPLALAVGTGAAAAAAVVVVATLAAIRSRHAGPAGVGGAFANVERIAGEASVLGPDRRALGSGMPLAAGSELAVAAGATLALALDGQASLTVDGPARLALLGDPGHVLLRLDAGTLLADVAHRRAGQTFVVALGATRVEVRGTRFRVGYDGGGGGAGAGDGVGRRPWVAVLEGRVAVASPGQPERLVSAGERYQLEAAPSAAAPAPPEEAGPEAGEEAPERCSASSKAVAAACGRLAGRARVAMRGRRYGRALSLVDEGLSLPTAASGCPQADIAALRAAACIDDLRYLRAEALRLDGRLEQAVATYRSLDRSSAPAAMRQNALYAAGQIEQRRGRARAALDSFERALAVAPRGALREEAMLGAMEAAAAAGDAAATGAAARRYLGSFPDGRGAAAARRLSGDPGGQRPAIRP
jgi:anti-sigma factor RsiW